MTYLVFGLYSLFAVTTVSASFGSAVAVTSSYLLFFASCGVCFCHRHSFRLLSVEWLALLLVGWLIIASLVQSNAGVGVQFVIEEYRLLWMVPIIAFALAMHLSRSQVWAPLILGSIFNFLGTTMLVLAKAYKFGIAYDSVKVLGIHADGKGSRYALNGKFVQAWLMTLWAGVSFSWASWGMRLIYFVLGGSLTLLIVWMIYIGVLYLDARTGFFSALAVAVVLAFLLVYDLKKRMRSYLAVMVVSLICGGSYFLMLSPPKRIDVGLSNIERFMSGEKKAEATSIGHRLVVWRELANLTPSDWMIGFGSGNWQQVIDDWFPDGHVGRRFVVWNDYHSQWIWLVVQGGGIALALYILFASMLFIQSVRLIVQARAFALGGLGIGIVGVLVIAGAANSVFTALREAHVTGLALMAWCALYRKHTLLSRKN